MVRFYLLWKRLQCQQLPRELVMQYKEYEINLPAMCKIAQESNLGTWNALLEIRK